MALGGNKSKRRNEPKRAARAVKADSPPVDLIDAAGVDDDDMDLDVDLDDLENGMDDDDLQEFEDF